MYLHSDGLEGLRVLSHPFLPDLVPVISAIFNRVFPFTNHVVVAVFELISSVM